MRGMFLVWGGMCFHCVPFGMIVKTFGAGAGPVVKSLEIGEEESNLEGPDTANGIVNGTNTTVTGETDVTNGIANGTERIVTGGRERDNGIANGTDRIVTDETAHKDSLHVEEIGQKTSQRLKSPRPSVVTISESVETLGWV